MAGMNVDGLISGLDTTSLISQLLQVEAAPQQALKVKVATQQRVVTAYQTINGRFVALQTLGDVRRKAVALALSESLPALGEENAPALAEGLRLLAETDLRTVVGRISQPVRLLHGEGDALMPPDAAAWLADHLPQGRLTVLSDCGHAPFLSRPADCATLLAGFADD